MQKRTALVVAIAKHAALTFDGAHLVIVSGSWFGGIWRYVEDADELSAMVSNASACPQIALIELRATARKTIVKVALFQATCLSHDGSQ